MRVLGIETSCDDTAAALYDSEVGLLAHRLATQVELHKPYGGVVPELAARDHIKTLLPLIDHLINEPCNGGRSPDAIAYTAGPGLAGALLVGAAVGKSLAQSWGIKAVGVHHLEGHLLAPMLESNTDTIAHPATAQPSQLACPLLALLVSGGHTMLVDVEAIGVYRILGQSLDDAAGEAFDKTAKLLGLGYPGGPAIAKAALGGQPVRFTFPRPMTGRTGLDFSFSGLKTHVRTTASQHELNQQTVADIALAFEVAVVDTLVIKCKRALQQSRRKRLVVCGGVGANTRLRTELRAAAAALGVQTFYPPPQLCTDNGAMIAYAGYLRLCGQLPKSVASNHNSSEFDICPRWRLQDI